ncbi:MAG: VanZ family protein [Anaerolineae bacterium]|nr:VanZ family protein [Anaerolineae bacterium]
MNRKHWFWWIGVILCATWLLWMTLRPQAQATADLAYITTPAVAHGISIRFLIDILGNMVVFMPLGAAATFALWRRDFEQRYARPAVGAILIGASLSAFIEMTQLLLPSRVATLGDWLLNTIGTLMGTFMALMIIRYRKSTKKVYFWRK